MPTLHATPGLCSRIWATSCPRIPYPRPGGGYTRRQRTPSLAPVLKHPRFRYPLHTFVCRRPLPYLLTLSDSDAYRLRDFVVKVQRRWANYHPFGWCPQARHRVNARRGGLAWFMYPWYHAYKKVSKSYEKLSFCRFSITLLQVTNLHNVTILQVCTICMNKLYAQSIQKVMKNRYFSRFLKLYFVTRFT